MIATHRLSLRAASTTPDHRLRALAVCGALVATWTLWLVSQALGVTLLVDVHNGNPPQLFGPIFLLSFTLLLSLLGWGMLAVLEHFTRKAVSVWTALAGIAIVLSFVPIAAADASVSAKIVLATIHISVAVVMITAMRRTAVRGRVMETGRITTNS
jgi:hypothetical protein